MRVRRRPAVILPWVLGGGLLVPMRNFFLGVVVGLFLAVVGASAYWAVSVETTYRRNTKEGLGSHAPYCMVVERRIAPVPKPLRQRSAGGQVEEAANWR
jgi:hypothetical protein